MQLWQPAWIYVLSCAQRRTAHSVRVSLARTWSADTDFLITTSAVRSYAYAITLSLRLIAARLEMSFIAISCDLGQVMPAGAFAYVCVQSIIGFNQRLTV